MKHNTNDKTINPMPQKSLFGMAMDLASRNNRADVARAQLASLSAKQSAALLGSGLIKNIC